MSSQRVLALGSCVGPLGHPQTGGVTRFLESTCAALAAAGYLVEVLAPIGSKPIKHSRLTEVTGLLQPTASGLAERVPWEVVPNSVIANMMREVLASQDAYDLIVNLNHDWLPFYLTPFFRRPLLHVPNLSRSCRTTDEIIAQVARCFPSQVAFLSRYQAKCFEVAEPRVLSFGLDENLYELGGGDGGYLCWAGRIVPEKGLGYAAQFARAARRKLRVAGQISAQDYWKAVIGEYGDTIEYVGFLERIDLQALLGRAQVFIQTQEWQEAFGIVTVESIMCGTPVVANRSGANSEIVAPGITGYLLESVDSPSEAVQAITEASRLSRAACREFALRKYSLRALSSGYKNWFNQLGSTDSPQ